MRILRRHFGLAKPRHRRKSIAQRFGHCSVTSSGKWNWPAMVRTGLPCSQSDGSSLARAACATAHQRGSGRYNRFGLLRADPEHIRAVFHRHTSRYFTWLVAESRFFLTLVKCQEPCRWQHDRNRQRKQRRRPTLPDELHEAFSILMPAPIPT
jgi:hypothetical protein